MNKEQFEELQNQIEVVRMLITELTSDNLTLILAHSAGAILSQKTNQFLTEMMYKEMMRKDSDGTYIHEQPRKSIL